MDKLRLFQLFVTILIASQGIFYMLALAEAMKTISVPTFAETRKAIDFVITNRLRFLYYSCLLAGIVILFLSKEDMTGKVFICTLIATLLILVDVLMALKGSIPINNAFQHYPNGNVNWSELQMRWLRLIVIRGVLSAIALGALLFSWSK
jgi:hypothetical protein